MRQILLGMLCWSLIATTTTSLSAQEGPAQPGPEHALLKGLEGNWDCVLKIGGQESKGTSSMKMTLGGLWLVSDFAGEFGGQKFSGHGLDGYDQDKKRYVTAWFDSMTSSFMSFEGTYDDSTKTLNMIADGKGPDGKPAKYRTTTKLKDKDRHVFTMYLVTSDGEHPMMSIEYNRK